MRSIIAGAALLLSTVAAGQNCPPGYLGTKTLYPVASQTSTPPPAGYAPVLINHVGRHGARHLTKDVATSYAFSLTAKADSLRMLTDAGKKLRQLILALEKIEKKDFESISAEGKKEQHGLARRMATNYPAVFASAPVIGVRVAKKLRTAQSADAFLGGLPQNLNAEGIKKSVNDTILRFYDLSPAYGKFEKDGEWKTALEEWKKGAGISNLATQFAQGFFASSFLRQVSGENAETFLDDVYGFATIVPSLREEIAKAGYTSSDVNFLQFFTCAQLATLNRLGEAEDFLVKGPGTDPAGIQVKIATPLLMDFINTTDAAIAAGKPAVQLRFSHAETVAPFAALLGLHGAATPVRKLDDAANVWQASKVIPLSANIQWILYQKPGSNDYLVKFLLNEKEVSVDGLSPKNFPYYKWTAVRKFYVAKLQSLQTTLDGNGYQYLLTVK